MSLVWVFDRVAQGLHYARGLPESARETHAEVSSGDAAATQLSRSTVDAPAVAARHVGKQVDRHALFDAQGAPLSPEAADATGTWCSHHAFGARCGLAAGKDSKDMSVPTSWSIAFALCSRNKAAHFLLSVAPTFFPFRGVMPSEETSEVSGVGQESEADRIAYEHRMLETPLIYEEPYTVSIECSARREEGDIETMLAAWSDEWQLYSKVLHVDHHSDFCAEDAPGTVPAFVRHLQLSWTVQPASLLYQGNVCHSVAHLTVEEGRAKMGSAQVRAAADCEWSRIAELTLPLTAEVAGRPFVPYVTLLDSGDEVSILS